jgi:hypothetical protein
VTDDIRDDAASDEEPIEAAPAAAGAETPENAPTAEEQVVWEKRYRDREKTVSRQGNLLGRRDQDIALLRAEVAQLRGAPPPVAPDDSALPPPDAQELAFYRSQYQSVAQQQVISQHGPEVADALSYMERAARLDPSPLGWANAFMAAVERLAESGEPEPVAPAPKPKPPARMESNRSDAAPPADEEKLVREAEKKPGDQKSLAALLGARLRQAGMNR